MQPIQKQRTNNQVDLYKIPAELAIAIEHSKAGRVFDHTKIEIQHSKKC